jgi:uncharacterized protein GlcG (DUF336 family)
MTVTRCRPLLVISAFVICLLAGATAPVQTRQASGPLTANDVAAVLGAAFSAIDDVTMAAAVVDRQGVILGVAARSGASATAPDQAVTIARTAGFFSNRNAPLSTRTIRFISGIHFPPGVQNTPNAPLYGIEASNRGCELVPGDPNAPWPRSRSISGSGSRPGVAPQACNTFDQTGCAIGDTIASDGVATNNVGINTGKNSFRDIGEPLNVRVNPSGFALYRNGQVIGSIGVAGVPPDRAEFAAIVGAAGTEQTNGIFPAQDTVALPFPGAVFIDGLRLPFFSNCTSIACIRDRIEDGPPGGRPGNAAFSFIVPPRPSTVNLTPLPPGRTRFVPSEPVETGANTITPEGFLLYQDNPSSRLTQADVDRIIDQAAATAARTRAQVRLPIGQTARMVITVTDEFGIIRGHYRMQDALADAVDVVPAKARTAYYFSTRAGYEELRAYLELSPEEYEWEPAPPAGAGWALTTRTLGFGANPLFPPGIDLEPEDVREGPWYRLFLYDQVNPCTLGSVLGSNPNIRTQNGMVWFAGSTPLYKNGVLSGGLGVSGDGIDQNDYVTAGGAVGFEPPAELRVDRSFVVTGEGQRVRLPFWKYPRNPEQK